MPVYLCQPGLGTSEPWRHGIQVYATPFAMEEDNHGTEQQRVTSPPATNTSTTVRNSNSNTNTTAENPVQKWTEDEQHHSTHTGGETLQQRATAQSSSTTASTTVGLPIRRVRHAEVVLVDDVCAAYDRYWLRLRWPGHVHSTRNKGFAGYIALGKVGDTNWWHNATGLPRGSSHEITMDGEEQDGENEPFVTVQSSSTRKNDEERTDEDEEDQEEEPQDNATRTAEPFDDNLSLAPLTCLRTGLPFPSSQAMKLMELYDDGLTPTVTSTPALPSEPVFCRICREGFHEDADDAQPSPAMENDESDNRARARSSAAVLNFGIGTSTSRQEDVDDDGVLASEPGAVTTPHQQQLLSKGPIQPHPIFHPNPTAAENPMLAPCECAGSMAFVHYMCVEQWRCRSHHPEALHGLHCETCGKPYALAPPSFRPTSNLPAEGEDWLEAMPPHVVAALRNPHIWWRIGAEIVRRRWLRPIAPVIMSPIVALYCRARRLLKKKGVARRRWACSLCRRRARWKCVRCLRSYYCSRPCQNVSWHIVHKHVCYKPARWGWSLVVYGVLTLLLFPGILRDPLMYDLGFGFVPASFYIMAVLGGGIATATKLLFGLDLRGRLFEVIVILATLLLSYIGWGLVGAFFGDPSGCYGALGSLDVSLKDEDEETTRSQYMVLHALSTLVFRPAQRWFLMCDRLALNSGPFLRKAFCTPQQQEEGDVGELDMNVSGGGGCFEHLHMANANFFLLEEDGAKCASDIYLICWLVSAAILSAGGTHFWKQRERQRRAERRHRPHHPAAVRLHQD